MSITRILFASDIHGSKMVWLKFLNAIKVYKANIAIMGGDLSAKEILPIIYNAKSNSYQARLLGKKYNVKSKQELDELQEQAKYSGIIPFITDSDSEELQRISNDPTYQRKFFEDLDVSAILEWIEIAKNTSFEEDTRIIIIPGNDDSKKIDDILIKDNFILHPDLELDTYHKLISFEYVNPTPWNSQRELPEKELKKKLKQKFDSVNDYDHIIAAIHAPPFKSGLDLAPKLDKKQRVVHLLGAPYYSAVGSKAVREIIEEYQPKLTLHGHIHESGGFTYIGKTLSVNPGSEYNIGVLKAYLIELSKEKIENFKLVEDTGIKRLAF